MTSLILLQYTILLLSECITEIFICLYLFSPVSLVGSCCSCCLLFFRDIHQAHLVSLQEHKLNAGLLEIS